MGISVGHLVFMLYLLLLKLSTEQGRGEFSVRKSSPSLIVIVKGQPLQLNITLKGTEETMPMLVFLDWNFRAQFSRTDKRLVSVTWDRGHVVSQKFYDVRASILDSASLVMVDTTEKDSGTYWCNAYSLPSQHYPSLYFNVTVDGDLSAEMQCPSTVMIAQGKNFSCWCNAHSSHFTPSVSWKKKGVSTPLEGRDGKTRKELFLGNVGVDSAGTYLCRAQLYSMINEKKLTLTVQYAPKIHTFQGKVVTRDSMTMTCLATGLPKPTYVIELSNGISLTAGVDGLVVIHDYQSYLNASYTCIARNRVGEDKWHLNGILTLSKDEPDKKQGTFVEKYTWYIISGSIIVGIILGFLLLKACQMFIRGRSRRRNQNNADSNETPFYVDPATLPTSWKKQPVNYIDVHVLPNLPSGGGHDDLPVYIDPDLVVPSRAKLRQAREESQGVQARGPENQEENPIYQAPEESSTNEGFENNAEENRAEEDIQANPEQAAAVERRRNCESRPRPRAVSEPMTGYQDLDSSDEIEENFYHSLRLATEGPRIPHYYVNEAVKVKK